MVGGGGAGLRPRVVLTLDGDERFDYYSWGSLKYFLANYERHLRGLGGQSIQMSRVLAPQDPRYPNDFYHREHIWARKEKTLVAPEDDYHKRRLANFVLLEPAINIAVSDDPVDTKLDKYDAIEAATVPNARMLRELRAWFKQAEKEELDAGGRVRRTHSYWYRVLARFFDKREEKLVAFALERWGVDCPGQRVERVTIDSLSGKNEVYAIRHVGKAEPT